jgi:hypothetical protein
LGILTVGRWGLRRPINLLSGGGLPRRLLPASTQKDVVNRSIDMPQSTFASQGEADSILVPRRRGMGSFFSCLWRRHQSDGRLSSPPFVGAHARGRGDSADGAGRRCMPWAKNSREAHGTRDVRLTLSRSGAIGPSEKPQFLSASSCLQRDDEVPNVRSRHPPRSQISERCPYHLAQNGQMRWTVG